MTSKVEQMFDAPETEKIRELNNNLRDSVRDQTCPICHRPESDCICCDECD